VYAVLVLVSVGPGSRGEFVPHISVTLTLLLVVVDLAVLIFFIDHIAKSIQLPQVIASIARDLSNAIAGEVAAAARAEHVPERGPSVTDLSFRLSESGGVVPATSSGYLQFVRYDTLIAIASRRSAVIRLLHRPGHFLVQGHPLAIVLPAEAAPEVARSLERAHATGSFRTLTQDLSFAIDQMVEIGIRALSPAVNDTFTALTCVDWLGESLCRIAADWSPTTIHRDGDGRVRVITPEISFVRLLERSFEKIRQASRGMPAVMIRQLDALAKVVEYATTSEQCDAVVRQAKMIARANAESVPDENDRADVDRRYDTVLTVAARRFDDPVRVAGDGPPRLS
jgi:uncharacterized membrane protein